MRIKKKIFYFFLLSSIWLSGCAIFMPGYKEYSTAKKYFDAGNYHQTIIYISKSLQEKPDNDDALTLLELAYPMAISQHESRANILRAKTIKSKWPKLVDEYETLNELTNEVRKLKSILNLEIGYQLNLNIKDYTNQLIEAKPLAADYHYMKALDYRKELFLFG